MNSDNANPQEKIIKGLMKQMKPIQALVMFALYQQFPERYIYGNQYYFFPNLPQIIKALKIKEAVVYLMLTRLVADGYLERRGTEYRIVFDKLHPFVEKMEK